MLIVDAFENRNAIENLRLDGGIEFIGSDFFALIDNSGDDVITKYTDTTTVLTGGAGDDVVGSMALSHERSMVVLAMIC